MPDYAKMYYQLFHAMTESIEILQRAQQDTEELYLSAKEPELYILDGKTVDEAGDQPEK